MSPEPKAADDDIMPVEPLLIREEAAHIIRKRPSWMRYAERHRLIPYVKVGQAIRYRPSDLRAWIEAHVVSK